MICSKLLSIVFPTSVSELWPAVSIMLLLVVHVSSLLVLLLHVANPKCSRLMIAGKEYHVDTTRDDTTP